MANTNKEVAIGIDLGTTYSCVALFKGGQVEVIANEHGLRTTPSYVAFNDNERLIGEAAKIQAGLNHENTVFGKPLKHYLATCQAHYYIY